MRTKDKWTALVPRLTRRAAVLVRSVKTRVPFGLPVAPPNRLLLAALAAPLLLCALPTAAFAQNAATTEPPAPIEEPVQEPEPEPTPDPDPSLTTPERTVQRFYESMARYARTQADDDLVDAMDCCYLSAIETDAAQREAATNLYNILIRIGPFVYQDFPIYYPESETRFTYFPQNRLPKHDKKKEVAANWTVDLARNAIGEWRFDSKTLEYSSAALSRFEQFAPITGREVTATIGQRLRKAMPLSLRQGSFLSLEYWLWLMILAAIVAGIVLDHIVRFVITLFWRAVRKRRGTKGGKGVLKAAVRPFGLLAASILWLALLRTVGGIPPPMDSILLVAVRLILSFASVMALWRLIDLLAELLASKASRTTTRFDDLLVPLVARTVKMATAAVAIIYIANSFNLEIMPLLTGLGLGGLAIAFAAKDTIENFFGSIAVIVDRPFEIGDSVALNGVEGTVESMGLRSTRVRTFYNSMVTIPNATLVRATVDNKGRRHFRRYKTTIGLTYDTPTEKIETFCEGVRELIRGCQHSRKDSFEVWLNGFGPSSLDVMLYMFFTCKTWSEELEARHTLMLDILRLAERLGVEIAFPTQTLHVHQEGNGQ